MQLVGPKYGAVQTKEAQKINKNLCVMKNTCMPTVLNTFSSLYQLTRSSL